MELSGEGIDLVSFRWVSSVPLGAVEIELSECLSQPVSGHSDISGVTPGGEALAGGGVEVKNQTKARELATLAEQLKVVDRFKT